MKKLVRTLTAPMAVAAIATALTILSTGSAKAQDFFQGAVSGDITNSANFASGGGFSSPTYTTVGGVTTETTTNTLYTQSSVGGNGLDYTAVDGTSTYGNLIGGDYANDVAGNQFAGGTLNFSGTVDNIIGYSNASSLTVDGATVNFLGTSTAGEGAGVNNSLTLGLNAAGTLSLTSGLVTVANSLNFSYYGSGAGVLNVSGGTFDVLGTGGTVLQGAGSTGTGTLNFLAGGGVFEETASAVFASGIKVNFAAGSGGLFEVDALNDATFAALANAGSLSYGGTVLTGANYLNYLTETQNAGVETLSVAAPEPSTWALMLGGLGALVLIQRRRSFNS